MACNDCFNGCTQTVSDQCIKYTGNNIAHWDVEKGDPLSEVISKLKAYLDDIASGDNILPDIETPCADIPVGAGTLNDILDSITNLVCELKESIDEINDYTFTNVNCVTDTSPLPTDLLPIVNTTLAHICTINGQIQQLELDVANLETVLEQYVKISEINNYILAYINSLPFMNKYYTRMVPYVVEKYYGKKTQFSYNGAGTGIFQYIYLCNGIVGTPDLENEFTSDYVYIMHVPPGGLPE